jgi:FG-GAP-like repeat
MKSSSLSRVPFARLLIILSVLCAIAAPVARAQVSFLQPLTFPGSTSEVDADFNRDGKLDIATPGTLLLGNGDGTFKTPINLSVSGNLVATADFNGDGNPDLLIASATILNVLLGNGDGTFQPAKITDVGISLGEIVVADVNGDGKPDLLGWVGTQVFVFLGNGDGTFKAGVPYAAGPNPHLMLTGDFNGDGKLDIATASADPGEIAVMLGNGDGTFQSPVTSTGVVGPTSAAAADLNNDGNLDLIISDGSTRQSYTFFGNGNGTFQSGIVAAPLVGGLAVADLNGDGKPDLVGADTGLGEAVALGNGDGTFTYTRSYAGGGNPLIADFTNDGKLDVACGGTMLLGNGDGTLKGQPEVVLPGGGSAAVGDFNGNGNADLAVTSSSDVCIFLGNAAGWLTMDGSCGLSAPEYSGAAGDLNGDGKLDLAFYTTDQISSWALLVLLGNGDGTFGAATAYQESSQSPNVTTPVMIADLRGDHKPYLAVVEGDNLVVLPNNGDGTFGALVSYFAGSLVYSGAIADFNGDGKLDAAVTSSAGIGILLGNGDGTFQDAAFIPTAVSASSIVTGDFNNDGKPDLIVSGQVFLGNGDGTFAALPPGNVAGEIDGIADFNGDGNLDLAEGDCTGTTSQFSLWCVQMGNGDGTFGKQINIQNNMEVSPGFAVVADFNGDGKPDIAIELDFFWINPPAGLFVLLNTTPPAPGVNVSPSALTFPSQTVGTSSSPMGVNLSNAGKGVLTLSDVKFTGANASEFSQTNNCAPFSRATIAPSKSFSLRTQRATHQRAWQLPTML